MKFLKDYLELIKPICIIYGLAMLFVYVSWAISKLQFKLKNKKR